MISKLFAGIDISSKDAVLCCLDQDGQQLGPSRSYTNDFDGANEFFDVISDFKVPFSNTSWKASLLRDFSPDELANMDTQELANFIANN